MSMPASPAAEVFGLFPTPVMLVPGCLDAELVAAMLTRLDSTAQTGNSQSGRLSHSRILAPESDALLARASKLVTPHLVAFGALLFGERLDWSVKEIWANFLQAGGTLAFNAIPSRLDAWGYAIGLSA